ncbi:hypothetical protein IMG5_063250 [Ichthyophthirius multifiliis]|uniref:Uncharacterized protein n=1 Tax=Ichthyophthirius multifiliis TaxID=5932 RepID=G0QP24_ICHMU|nr:hypothetical protein IMG5_063250 [Ichthyophthirius multifiliis]EGR33039.1 hypothetical protein IMG5_063250 [Ichthyophthirius multifiliis]|eukprot:XP_004037025.1 hypothetical protein IMG5_063250 [Ichthyophthirius multifiliis]
MNKQNISPKKKQEDIKKRSQSPQSQKNQKITDLNENSHSKINDLSTRLKNYIGTYIQAPEYIKDNIYIQSGYRINFSSTKNMLKSLFMVHNELVNIWTHIIGAIVIILLCVYISTSIGNIDIHSWKSYLNENLDKQLQPIYEEFNNLDEAFNKRINEGLNQINKANINIVQNINNFLDEVSDMKKEINPHNVYKIVEKFQNFSFSEKLAILDINNIYFYKNEIMKKLTELQQQVIDQIDSHQFDWIEFHINDIQNKNILLTNQSSHDISRWPIFVFLISAVLCLSFSSTFHLLYQLSPIHNKILLRMDYAGVSLLISGSTFPIFYYGFFCNQILAYFYMTIVGVASLIVFVVSLQDFIHTPKYWIVKSVMYASLGIFAAVPMLHLCIYEYMGHSNDSFLIINSVPYYLLMGVCYLGGLTIYAKRCPEKYKPGQYDICGASHQLWHISILFAILFTYIGALINFYTRKMSICK